MRNPIIGAILLAASVMAAQSNPSQDYNFHFDKKDFPAARADSDVVVTVSVPAPMLASIRLSAPRVVAGNTIQATVILNRAAAYDLEVSLAAEPFNAAKLPRSLIVPAGQTSAAFTIETPLSKRAVGGEDSVVGIYANYGVTRDAHPISSRFF